MPKNCCDVDIDPDAKNKKLLTLAAYMRQSVFCGVSGAAKTVIAFSSYIQAATLLGLYRKKMDFADAERIHNVKVAALRGIKQGILPSIEMFILMPVMFAGLHLYANMPLLACIAICWTTMFSVCLLARLTKIVSKCPTLEHPMYESGTPFPKLEGSSDGIDGLRYDPLSHSKSSQKKPTLWEIYGVTLLFLIPRLLTIVGSLVVLTVETLCLAPMFLRDTFSALSISLKTKSCIRCNFSSAYSKTLYQKEVVSYLVATTVADILWVATLGLGGIIPLATAIELDYFVVPPTAQKSEVLAPAPATTLQEGQSIEFVIREQAAKQYPVFTSHSASGGAL